MSISIVSTAQIENQTNLLCSDIKRVFHRRKGASNVEGKKLVIAKTRQWMIESIVCRKEAKAVGYALASILRTLDDVDASKLQYNISAHAHKKRKVRNKFSETSHCAIPKTKRRRRLPHNSCSLLHDMGEFSDDDSLPKMYLSSSDRYKRAKRSFMQSQNSCSMMGISLKAMNALVSKSLKDEDGIDISPCNVITTLTHDAAVLRRDLYKHLSEFDTADIKTLVEESKCSRSDIIINNTHQTKVDDLTSTLLERISLNPESPSMRLSAIITLDSVRQLELSDLGYRCILYKLLDESTKTTSLNLNFYAEILCECHAYENPMRLLSSITKLMERALEMQKQIKSKECTDIPRAISHIMVRRQSILSSLNNQDAKCSLLLRKEIDLYRRLCDKMSVSFDSISHWISPTMPHKEEVISALQAEGILSMFCELAGEELSPQKVEEYPYPEYQSLRAAHDRMGPCDGVNLLLSHPVSYEQSIAKPDYFMEDSLRCDSLEVDDTEYPFSHASDDIIVNVLSFLGYRSLARASQVSVGWRRASNSRDIWAGIYFAKFRNRCPRFEGELAADIGIAKDSDYFGNFLKIQNATVRQTIATTCTQYDWKHMLMRKYAVEKKHNGKKTCNIIGCLYVIRRTDHFTLHMKRHESSVRIQSKQRNSYKKLQTKVTKLRQRMSQMEKTCLKITNSALSEQKVELDSPHDVLRQLVFPYLDYKDIIVSSKVCKLWAKLVDSNVLWKSLYGHTLAPDQPLSCLPQIRLVGRHSSARKCQLHIMSRGN